MLLPAFLHYTLQYLFVLVLSYDTLGFIVQLSKNKEQASVQDYSRLVFSWVYVLSLKSLNCLLCCVPLIDDLILGGIVFFTLPVLRGTEKANAFLLNDEGFKSTFQGLVDLIINRIIPPKKN